jgi:hypothetical protein
MTKLLQSDNDKELKLYQQIEIYNFLRAKFHDLPSSKLDK